MSKPKSITKEMIMQKMVEKWAADNPDLIKDITNLATELTLFNMKWGTQLEPTDFLPKSNV